MMERKSKKRRDGSRDAVLSFRTSEAVREAADRLARDLALTRTQLLERIVVPALEDKKVST